MDWVGGSEWVMGDAILVVGVLGASNIEKGAGAADRGGGDDIGSNMENGFETGCVCRCAGDE